MTIKREVALDKVFGTKVESLIHIEGRLSKTNRANLWGFWLMTFGVPFKQVGNTFSFTSTRSAESVLSPAYFGTVDFEIRGPNDNPNLIKDQLSDLSTDTLLFGAPEPEFKQTNLLSPVHTKKLRRTALKLIPEPGPLSRSVIHRMTNQIPPQFSQAWEMLIARVVNVESC